MSQKKIKISYYYFLIMFFMINCSNAKDIIITVTNNNFNPSKVNAKLGDVVSYFVPSGTGGPANVTQLPV